MPLPCRYLAAGGALQDVFWGTFDLMPLVIYLSSTQLISQHLGHLSQSLVELFDSMCSDDPGSRPSAAMALDFVRQLSHSRETLLSYVPNPASG